MAAFDVGDLVEAFDQIVDDPIIGRVVRVYDDLVDIRPIAFTRQDGTWGFYRRVIPGWERDYCLSLNKVRKVQNPELFELVLNIG